MKNIFGTRSDRELKRIRPVLNKIEDLRTKMQALSDDELKLKTEEFKSRLQAGETPDDILPEAFAVVREAAKRSIGMEHFPVQLEGGIILHQGRIAEMATGEGKTLVATCPAYLNALTGKGVHIITVNDYLAKRDADEMGKVHRFLGLSVGCVLADMDNEERKRQYACDITYVTNNEAGFDYLKDNMATSKDALMQRGLIYAIIDEVDSVLIDEARTPLIISGPGKNTTDVYTACDAFAKSLIKGEASDDEETGDYIVDEKEKTVTLTSQGTAKAERFFHIGNLADTENIRLRHYLQNALRANSLMHKDRDYIVKNDEVLIVDEFTGRVLPGRRYSESLHQAIEAKEHVTIQKESSTLATITFQSLFNKYKKISGMTGTALTEEQEFREIYGMDVVTIPTNRPVIRKDLDDYVYMTKEAKFAAVIKEIKAAREKAQPVLVGTTTVETSEYLSTLLKAENIPHQVLNAVRHAEEAEIISHAGEAGTVTIATNMAGRGTDIKIDEAARQAGGLKIIGTERHESRRIDNQLRGRSGRQGDPGESRFFLSLEDDLMRLFGSEKTMKVLKALKTDENEPLNHKMLTSAVEKAQKRLEENNFAIRKSLLDYDRVNDEQRNIIYTEREKVLNGEDMKSVIQTMTRGAIRHIAETAIDKDTLKDDSELQELNTLLTTVFPIKAFKKEDLPSFNRTDIEDHIIRLAEELYEETEKEFSDAGMDLREVERYVLLTVIDGKWMEHVDNLEFIKSGIGLASYGQKDPKIEYKLIAYDMFEVMSETIRIETVMRMYHVHPAKEDA